MSVHDLAHEAARRYVDTLPLEDYARRMLETLRVPPAAPTQGAADDLVGVWRRILEAAVVEHYTIPELLAATRFNTTPEGASLVRKADAFRSATLPVLATEILAHARAIAARVQPPAPASATPSPKEDSQ